MARREILQLYRQLQEKQNESVVQIQGTHIAYLATLMPFTCSLQSVGETIANTLVWAAFEDNSKRKWWSWYEKIHDACLEEMADEVLNHLTSSTRSLVELSEELPKDNFNDPRLEHRWLNFNGSRKWFVVNLRDKQARKLALAALDTFGRCQFKAAVSSEDLRPIGEAACSMMRSVREMGVGMLLLLAREFEAARGALLGLLSNPRGEIRFTAMSHFGYWRIPFAESFVEQFLERGFSDKSGKIRVFAAQGCDRYDCKRLIPLLEEFSRIEVNPKNQRSLAYSLAMLRDGYLIHDEKGRDLSITVKCERGYSNVRILREQLKPDKLSKIVERIRRDESYFPAEDGDN